MTRDNLIETAKYRARLAGTPGDVARAQALRGRVFRGGRAVDADAFDPLCRHLLIEETASGALVGCMRILTLQDGNGIKESYAAQFYDLSPLAARRSPMLELGRFCIAPEAQDPDVLRLAWAALTKIVDGQGVEMLFGCASFPGTDPQAHLDAFALLKARHIAPRDRLPGVKAPEVFRFARQLQRKPDVKRALKTMPTLLRTYLLMGGWVSDHAVIDRDLATLHVFTGVEVCTIPAPRLRALRGMGRAYAASVSAPSSTSFSVG